MKTATQYQKAGFVSHLLERDHGVSVDADTVWVIAIFESDGNAGDYLDDLSESPQELAEFRELLPDVDYAWVDEWNRYDVPSDVSLSMTLLAVVCGVFCLIGVLVGLTL